MQANRETIIYLIVVTTIIVLVMTTGVILILLLYKNKQTKHFRNLDLIKATYEKNLLHTQLEIHEQTLQQISREIHDNIGLSLTLAKLNLNLLTPSEELITSLKVSESKNLISKAIQDLTNISHSLNSNMIENNGLIKAVESEIERINKTGVIEVGLIVCGNSIFLDNQKELLLFRIVQEALNNIIKYAGATKAEIRLNYEETQLYLTVKDNGNGFCTTQQMNKGSGILNMKMRSKILNGTFHIQSTEHGTNVEVTIPIN